MNKRSRRKRKRSSIIVLVVVVIRYNSIHTFHSLIIYCKWFTYDDHRYLLMLVDLIIFLKKFVAKKKGKKAKQTK